MRSEHCTFSCITYSIPIVSLLRRYVLQCNCSCLSASCRQLHPEPEPWQAWQLVEAQCVLYNQLLEIDRFHDQPNNDTQP